MCERQVPKGPEPQTGYPDPAREGRPVIDHVRIVI